MTSEESQKSLPPSSGKHLLNSVDSASRPFIVALTGGIGSGKSTVANAFAQLGVPVIDADIIARQVVAPGTSALAAITAYFGANALLPNGQLDRVWLKQQIFHQPEKRQWLNQLLHPLIRQETRRQISLINKPYLLWVVPLLVENRLRNDIEQIQPDRIVVVDVSREVQIARVVSRDMIERQQVEEILAAQATRQERLSYADDIIDNNRTTQQLTPQVSALHQRYLAVVNQNEVNNSNVNQQKRTG